MSFLNIIKDEARELAQMASGITFAKSYTTPLTRGKKTAGFPDNFFGQVDDKYKVVIENSEWVVNAWLQENFRFKTGSSWQPLISPNIPLVGAVTDGVSSMFKGLTGYALKNMAMTRRRWDGSEPLTIELKLKFRAYDNAEQEVLNAVRALQSMALPAESDPISIGGGFKGPVPGFLIPPGPNEFYATKETSEVVESLPGFGAEGQRFGGAGDIISIDMFGGGFYLDMIVVNSVDASFDPKMTDNGPVAAEVSVLLESYEVLTKSKLENAYGGVGYMTSSNKVNASAGRQPGVPGGGQ